MIHPNHGKGGGDHARDGRGERIAFQLCGPQGADPGAASAAQDPTGREQRWSRKFGPLVKVDRMMKVTIQNEETQEPFTRV